MIALELEIDYPDEATARAVMVSLEPENAGNVASELRGSKLLFSLSCESAGMMRGTADGLMASIKAAEEAVGVATGTAHDEEDDGCLLQTQIAVPPRRTTRSDGSWRMRPPPALRVASTRCHPPERPVIRQPLGDSSLGSR